MIKHMGFMQIMVFAAVFVLVFFILQLVIIWLNGRPVSAPVISRDIQTLGRGPDMAYVMMGDSTTIGQGATYDDGYALASARHLAERHRVRFVNLGISGALTSDIVERQLKHVTITPDVVLIGVGANDITHLTAISSVEKSMIKVINDLQEMNPDVRIVITGAPAMDTVDRFPWAIQRFAFYRVKKLNAVLKRLAMGSGVVFAPIADKTREAFKNDPTLFAPDKFHPNARGYALWIPVINQAIDEACEVG